MLREITEPELVRFLMHDKSLFGWSLDFMLRGAFERGRCFFFAPNEDFDSLLIALEIPRDELGLHADESPGDIDMLIVPQSGEQNLYDKSMAVEVKVVRPTMQNPSRNANSLGQTQSRKLANGGFPYVGLIHLVIPEASPEHMLSEIPRIALGDSHTLDDIPASPPEKAMADMFALTTSERQLGRLKKLGLPDYVGFNSVTIAIEVKEEGGETFLCILGHSIQQDRKVIRNPSASQKTSDLIKKHVENNPRRYTSVKWLT